jgi:hypothetical protein
VFGAIAQHLLIRSVRELEVRDFFVVLMSADQASGLTQESKNRAFIDRIDRRLNIRVPSR